MIARTSWWQPSHYLRKSEIVHVDLKANPESEKLAIEWLDPEEREQSRRHLTEKGRRQFVLCRAALRANLCAKLGCENRLLHFEGARLGKPLAFVRGEQVRSWDFSVSHGGCHGLIAFSRQGRVGVDVEERELRIDIDGAVQDAFSPLERHRLANSPREDRERMFLRIWTLKESIIKAVGEGFSIDTSEFEIPSTMLDGARTSRFRLPHMEKVLWELRNLENSSYAAAIAQEIL